MSIPRWIRFACVCVFAVVAALAQNNNGRINGTVTDNSGAVIPGASLTITNQETQLARKVTTDSNGYYAMTNLPVGTYAVEADAAGFRKVRQTGYDLVDNGR